MDEEIKLEKLTPATINYLYEGARICFPDIFYGPDYEPEKHRLALNWGPFNHDDFQDFLIAITYPYSNSRSIESAINQIKTWKALIDQGSYPNANIPAEINFLVEEYEQHKQKADEGQRIKLALKAKRAVNQLNRFGRKKEPSIKPPGKSTPVPPTTPVASSPAKESTKEKALNKDIFLEPDKDSSIPQLSNKALSELKTLVEEVKKNPTGFSRNLAQAILKKTESETPQPSDRVQLTTSAKQTAISFTDKLLALDPTDPPTLQKQISISYVQNPIHTTTSLASPRNEELSAVIPSNQSRQDLSESAQGLSLLLEHDSALSKTLLSPFVNREILNLLYPTSDNLFPLAASATPQPRTVIRVDPSSMTRAYQSSIPSSPLLQLVKDEAVNQIKTTSLKALDRTLANTPWYQKARPFIGRLIPGYSGPPITTVGQFFRYQPGLISLWTSQDVPLLATNLRSLLNTATENNFLLTPTFNFQAGTFTINRAMFTTAEGLTGQALGINLGNFGITFTQIMTEKGSQFAINIAVESATQTATAVASEAAIVGASETVSTGLGAQIGAFLGIASGPLAIVTGLIGLVIGWLVGKILPKILSWLKRNKEKLAFIVAVSSLAAGILLGAPLLTAVALISFFGALIASGGISALGSGATSFFNAGLQTITHVVFPTIATPFIIAVLAIPPITAFILFVINSGAYLVPPRDITNLYGGGGSWFTRIEKKADPNGNLPNSPQVVNYEITITALKGTLTNLEFNDDCSVSPTGNCPEIEKIKAGFASSPTTERKPYNSIEEISTLIESIKPTDPLVITYTRTFGGSPLTYSDSRISDSFRVATDVSGTRDIALGSSSLCFGDCPSGCFRIVDEHKWPSNYLSNLNQAISDLVSSYPSFIDKICPAGGEDIPICYDRSPHKTTWGCHNAYTNLSICHLSIDYTKCDITLFSGGLGDHLNAMYILAHEASHHLDSISNYFAAYDSFPGIADERPLCSYPSGNPNENFAEAIALYTSNKPFACFKDTFQETYPRHWQFVNDDIIL